MNDIHPTRFLVALVESLQRSGWVGKTHIQKATYFAQKAAGLDLGFRFVIHHYGPYSFELDSVVHRLEAQGVLAITPEPDGYGYRISLGDEIVEERLTGEEQRRVERVGGFFSGLSTSELELLSTSYYVVCRFPMDQKQQWIGEIKRLKPRFDEDQISKAIDESQAIAQELSAPL